jgi:hypothetical protein
MVQSLRPAGDHGAVRVQQDQLSLGSPFLGCALNDEAAVAAGKPVSDAHRLA